MAKTKKQRSCKYGPRLENGKCPTKQRSCKYGPRLENGKCPTKQSSCKYGPRLENGKCPTKHQTHKKIEIFISKSKSPIKSKSKSPIKKMLSTVAIKVYLNGKYQSMNDLSGTEEHGLSRNISNIFDIDSDNLIYGEWYNEETDFDDIALKNAEIISGKLFGKYELNKKIPFEFNDFHDYWDGKKIELYFYLI